MQDEALGEIQRFLDELLPIMTKGMAASANQMIYADKLSGFGSVFTPHLRRGVGFLEGEPRYLRRV